MRLKYVVVIGDQLPEDVLFVETGAAKTSVFQLGKREVMERVFDVIELVFGELLAAAKGTRVERIRGGRFGVHIFISCARVRRSPLRCFSQNQRAKRVVGWGKERERQLKFLKSSLSSGENRGEKCQRFRSGNHQSSHIGRLRKTENKILVMIVKTHIAEVGTSPSALSSLSLLSLSLFSPREKTKVRYN